jgi:hypothetical protein
VESYLSKELRFQVYDSQNVNVCENQVQLSEVKIGPLWLMIINLSSD